MARPKKNNTAVADVVGSTLETKKTEAKTGANVVTIAVALRCGHKFTDVPNGQGGVKTVYLAGLDDNLRGNKGGILAPDGNCIFQTLDATDWENIKAMHGRERMFTGHNGHSPCVFEIKGGVDNKSAYADEIANTSTGVAPLDATKQGVVTATDNK
jgi:hypothetical protein